MKILTITQSGYELVADHNILPGEFSANVEIEFIKDIAYKDYTVLPSLKYGNKTYPLPFADGLVTLPPQAFEQDGPIYLAFLLSNGDENINTYSVELFVPESVGGSTVLPDDKEIWVKVVQNQVEQIYQKEYKDPLEETTRKSFEATNTAKEETKKLVDVREDVELKLNNGEFVPNFKIGTVQTGTTSKATITGEKKNPLLNLTLQKGDKGDTGSQGIQGLKGIQGEKGDKGDGILSIKIVQTLPATGETSAMYFILNNKSGNNVYDEYMWINNKWELIGSTQVDLSDYYTKLEIDSKINYLKPYGIEESETSLIKTLDRIYKDQIKDVGNYDPIEKIFYININTENASYNFMGLKNNSSYYVKMYQDIRQGDRGVLFTFMNFAVENMDDSFLHIGQDSSGNLIESQHVVKRKTDVFVQSDTIKNEIVLTQAQYDALSSKDNATVYFITE